MKVLSTDLPLGESAAQVPVRNVQVDGSCVESGMAEQPLNLND